jgi:hypothetical protein
VKPTVEQQTRAALQFVAWLDKFSPEMAAAVVQRVGEAPKNGPLNNLSGLWEMGQFPGEDASATSSTKTTGFSFSWASDLLNVAKEVVPAYMAYDAQKDLMAMNIERAKQGLPPIDPGVVAPQVTVVHSLPPEVQTQISAFKMGGMNILLWGALAVGGFFVVRMLK